jgi:tetratricopeptide (TPR) repeat protein
MRPANRRKTFLLLLCATLAFGACQIPEQPVSREEAQALGQRIERSIARRDTLLLNHIFDEKALARRVGDAMTGSLFSRAMISGAVKGVVKGGLGGKVVQAVGKEGTYQLIREYEKDGRAHLLFRMFGGEGVNYHDYELVKRDDQVKAGDLYVYTSGENISLTLANALMRLNKEGSNKDLTTTDNIRELMDRDEFQKARAEYEKLPVNPRSEKAYQMMHVRIESHLSTDEYIAALNEYKGLYPHDPNMYLLMVDAYTLQKDYPRALESVNKLDSLVGRDPFQDYERGLIYKMMDDTANERLCVERLHKNMPDFKAKGLIQLAH